MPSQGAKHKPFYPFTKDRREKRSELEELIFDEESASDAQKFLAPPKFVILEKKLTPIFSATKAFKKHFDRRKMKCWKSSETRFDKV